MSVNRDNLTRVGALQCLVLDAGLTEQKAEDLMNEAYDHPGDWRQAGKVRLRKDAGKERFSVRA